MERKRIAMDALLAQLPNKSLERKERKVFIDAAIKELVNECSHFIGTPASSEINLLVAVLGFFIMKLKRNAHYNERATHAFNAVIEYLLTTSSDEQGSASDET